MKIAVAGTGYVGLSNAVLLAQHNEAETLQIALDHLPRHIEGINQIEVLIINDGSTDATVQVAREWGVNHIVSFKQNRGLARGFMAGVDACLHLGADIIVNTDADDQYCGEDIEKLVRPIMISGLRRRALQAKRTDRPRNKNAFCTGLVPVDFAQRT